MKNCITKTWFNGRLSPKRAHLLYPQKEYPYEEYEIILDTALNKMIDACSNSSDIDEIIRTTTYLLIVLDDLHSTSYANRIYRENYHRITRALLNRHPAAYLAMYRYALDSPYIGYTKTEMEQIIYGVKGTDDVPEVLNDVLLVSKSVSHHIAYNMEFLTFSNRKHFRSIYESIRRIKDIMFSSPDVEYKFHKDNLIRFTNEILESNPCIYESVESYFIDNNIYPMLVDAFKVYTNTCDDDINVYCIIDCLLRLAIYNILLNLSENVITCSPDDIIINLPKYADIVPGGDYYSEDYDKFTIAMLLGKVFVSKMDIYIMEELAIDAIGVIMASILDMVCYNLVSETEYPKEFLKDALTVFDIVVKLDAGNIKESD